MDETIPWHDRARAHPRGRTVIGADGQVTVGQTVMKHRRARSAGCTTAGSLRDSPGPAADAFTLFAKFEDHLEKYGGNLERAAVELAREWRTDKYLRQLEALLAVLERGQRHWSSPAPAKSLSPTTASSRSVPADSYALAAARMLVKHSTLPAREIVEESLRTAAGICIYTNDQYRRRRALSTARDGTGVTHTSRTARPRGHHDRQRQRRPN